MGTTSNLPSISTFNGTSQYAADLQQAINQAVTVASIPLTQLQNNVSTLQGESSELTTLQTDFAAIQTSIQSLSSTSGAQSLAASVSDATVASASVDTAATVAPGTYSLNVISAGSASTSISSAGLPVVTNPDITSISSSNTFTVTVNGTNYGVNPAANTLDALAEAINSANIGVSATIVNIGPPSAPDYRLSLQSLSLGNIAIQLNDGTQNLLTSLTTGTPAQYQVDGQPSTAISSDSSTVTLAPGVTANLLQAGQTTVTVAPDSSSASNALSSFATAYNSALAELSNNHGTSGGALTGQSIVFQLQQSLRNLTQYSGGSGTVQSLGDLGLTFNQQGQLSFNQGTFEAAAATSPNDVANFLGSATSGGFLENATNLLTSLTDPNTGLFQATNSSFQSQINTDNQEITDTQTRIITMQNSMVAQMTQADTLIASLESQDSYYTTLFTDTQNALTNGG